MVFTPYGPSRAVNDTIYCGQIKSSVTSWEALRDHEQ